MKLFAAVPFLVFVASTVACGGETEGKAETAEKATTASASSAQDAAPVPVTPSSASDVAALLTTAQSSPTCTLDDVRGPFTDFSDAPLVALGLSCPVQPGEACYKATVPNTDLVVCREPDGKLKCASAWGEVSYDQFGYDCCVKDAWSSGNEHDYQCYWLK